MAMNRSEMDRRMDQHFAFEAQVVCKDVLQLDDAETRKVKRWAIRALVQGALRPDAAT